MRILLFSSGLDGRSGRLVGISVEAETGRASLRRHDMWHVHLTDCTQHHWIFPFLRQITLHLLCSLFSFVFGSGTMATVESHDLSNCQNVRRRADGLSPCLSERRCVRTWGLAGGGALTCLKMYRGGGGTWCLFLKSKKKKSQRNKQRNREKPQNTNTSAPQQNQPANQDWRNTGEHTLQSLQRQSLHFLFQSLFLHLDALICSYLTILQLQEKRVRIVRI